MQNDQQTIQHTIVWLEKIVIGLNLCPFAKAIHVKGQIRYVVSHATKSDALLCDLKREMQLLIEADPSEIESTLLIHPDVLQDFSDYNSFLTLCDLASRNWSWMGSYKLLVSILTINSLTQTMRMSRTIAIVRRIRRCICCARRKYRESCR